MWNRTSGHKYGAKKVETDGYSFASKLEAAVYQMLKLRALAGEIQIVTIQDHILLTEAKIKYIPDFKCLDLKTNKFFWCEAKGFKTDVFAIKKRLWKCYGPGDLFIYGGSYTNPSLMEHITCNT